MPFFSMLLMKLVTASVMMYGTTQTPPPPSPPSGPIMHCPCPIGNKWCQREIGQEVHDQMEGDGEESF
jgi:hypothetical protein